MRPYPKKVYDKEGNILLLRTLLRDEIDIVHEYFCAMQEADRRHLMFNVTDREQVRRFLEQIDGENVIRIGVEEDGRLIGIGSLYRDEFGWARHVGKIRVSVLKEYQSRGIACILSREIIYHAVRLGLEKLRASLMISQHKCEHILKKMGFLRECVLPGCIRNVSGREEDQLVMGLLL